jgi:hypothetical protein
MPVICTVKAQESFYPVVRILCFDTESLLLLSRLEKQVDGAAMASLVLSPPGIRRGLCEQPSLPWAGLRCGDVAVSISCCHSSVIQS